MANKKAAEIERKLKEIRELLDMYDSNWENLCEFNRTSASDYSELRTEGKKEQMRGKKHAIRSTTLEMMDLKHFQEKKQSIEDDLDDKLRKLHRFTHLLKDWYKGNDIRDKSVLNEMSKNIEQRFKKGSAYYCDGISSDDPVVDLGSEWTTHDRWLCSFITRVQEQLEAFDTEIERIKDEKSKAMQRRCDLLRGALVTHNLHLSHLRRLRHHIRNMHGDDSGEFLELDEADVDEVREALVQYIEENPDLDVLCGGEVYEPLCEFVDFDVDFDEDDEDDAEASDEENDSEFENNTNNTTDNNNTGANVSVAGADLESSALGISDSFPTPSESMASIPPVANVIRPVASLASQPRPVATIAKPPASVAGARPAPVVLKSAVAAAGWGANRLTSGTFATPANSSQAESSPQEPAETIMPSLTDAYGKQVTSTPSVPVTATCSGANSAPVMGSQTLVVEAIQEIPSPPAFAPPPLPFPFSVRVSSHALKPQPSEHAGEAILNSLVASASLPTPHPTLMRHTVANSVVRAYRNLLESANLPLPIFKSSDSPTTPAPVTPVVVATIASPVKTIAGRPSVALPPGLGASPPLIAKGLPIPSANLVVDSPICPPGVGASVHPSPPPLSLTSPAAAPATVPVAPVDATAATSAVPVLTTAPGLFKSIQKLKQLQLQQQDASNITVSAPPAEQTAVNPSTVQTVAEKHATATTAQSVRELPAATVIAPVPAANWHSAANVSPTASNSNVSPANNSLLVGRGAAIVLSSQGNPASGRQIFGNSSLAWALRPSLTCSEGEDPYWRFKATVRMGWKPSVSSETESVASRLLPLRAGEEVDVLARCEVSGWAYGMVSSCQSVAYNRKPIDNSANNKEQSGNAGILTGSTSAATVREGAAQPSTSPNVLSGWFPLALLSPPPFPPARLQSALYLARKKERSIKNKGESCEKGANSCSIETAGVSAVSGANTKPAIGKKAARKKLTSA